MKKETLSIIVYSAMAIVYVPYAIKQILNSDLVSLVIMICMGAIAGVIFLPKIIDNTWKIIKKKRESRSNLQSEIYDKRSFINDVSSLIFYIIGIAIVFVSVYYVFKLPIANDVFSLIEKYKSPLLNGVGTTLIVSLLAILIGTIVGCFFAFLIFKKTRINFFRPITIAIVHVLLSIPALVIIFLFFYSGLTISTFLVAVLALSVNLSPFVAKIIGGSLKNMPKDQIYAAQSFGFSSERIFRKFIAPFVIRHSLQPLLVEYYTTIKLSALAGYIGLVEAFHTSQDIILDTQDPIKGYIILTLCYLTLVLPIAILADYLEKRFTNIQSPK